MTPTQYRGGKNPDGEDGKEHDYINEGKTEADL